MLRCVPIPFVDLFAGCGGLTAGFVATGRFRPVAAVEHDPEAAATYAANFGDHLHVGDIAAWREEDMVAARVVVGGPPCQGFSALGRRDPEDPRNGLWGEYLRVLRHVDPEFFILENVPQFLGSDQFKALERETRARGRLSRWRIEAFELNSWDFGAAQARKRAIVIGRRAEIRPLGMPKPRLTRLVLSDVLSDVAPRVIETELPESWTDFRGERIRGIFKMDELHVTRRPGAISQARYRAIPPGGNRFNLPLELQTPGWRRHRSGSGDVMGRLAWDKPSVTIRTEFFKPEKGRYLHPEEHRPITHLEAALIQGFPSDFRWCGGKTAIARQIGNAVPVQLGQALAEHLIPHLDA